MIATIVVGIDPTISVGPLELAWHGIFIAIGLMVGLLLARRGAARDGLDPDAIGVLVLAATITGIVGARAVYLIEHGAIVDPDEWLGTNGYSFYGALISGLAAVLVTLRRKGWSLAYLDRLALAFPAAMAVGRLGDVINGEHYGPPTQLPWGVRYTHPEALTPDPAVAYHAGGLYEVALALAIVLVLWPLRPRLHRRLQVLWTVVGLYAAGRLAMFAWRLDSPSVALGLDSSQLISVGLLLAAAAGFLSSSRPTPRSRVRRAASG